jgi:hypothetical protein
MRTTNVEDADRSIPSDSPTPAAEVCGAQTPTYDQILRSSALIGGSSVASLAIGVVRTKALAILLGPSSFGLIGLYGSIVEFVRSIATLGVNSSGVRWPPRGGESIGTGWMT